MSDTIRSLKQLNKATRLVNRTFHKNGPKCFKHGQGALLKVLHRHDGEMSSGDLVEALSFDRKHLKDVVHKAEKGGYVRIEGAEGKRSYIVKLTEAGEEVAEKRCAAQEEAAAGIMAALTPEETAQLDAITEKLILRTKELGAHGARKHGRKGCKGHGHGHGGKRCKKH